MRGTKLAKAMEATIHRLVNSCEGTGTLDRAIETIVGTIARFEGKNATSYLEPYRAKMIMRDILEDRRRPIFPRVVTPSIHAEVLKMQVGCQTRRSLKGGSLRGMGSMTRVGYQNGNLWNGLKAPKRGGTSQCSSRSSRNGLLGSLHWTELCSTRAVSCYLASPWMRMIGRRWAPYWRWTMGSWPTRPW